MTSGGIEKEEIGAAYLEEHHGGTWVKCSWNTYTNVHLQGNTPFRAIILVLDGIMILQ